MFISDSKEDKVLLSKVDDALSLSQMRNKPCFLGFLNERELYIIKDYLSWNSDTITFYGGYNDATRVMMCCCSYSVDYGDFPIMPVYFKFRKADKLTHRDFLGALMSLGVERSCVGDILVSEGKAICYLKNDIYDYVVSQITKIGKVGVAITDSFDVPIVNNNKDIEITVASSRLDVVVSALTGLSRAKTNNVILSGKVFVNYNENKNFSYTLKSGDVLTIRSTGKFLIKEFTGVTKKGRLKILIEQYR